MEVAFECVDANFPLAAIAASVFFYHGVFGLSAPSARRSS